MNVNNFDGKLLYEKFVMLIFVYILSSFQSVQGSAIMIIILLHKNEFSTLLGGNTFKKYWFLYLGTN